MGRFAELLQPAPQRTRFSHLLKPAEPSWLDRAQDALGYALPAYGAVRSLQAPAGQMATAALGDFLNMPRAPLDWASRQVAGRLFGLDVNKDNRGLQLQRKPTSAEVGLDALIPAEVGEGTGLAGMVAPDADPLVVLERSLQGLGASPEAVGWTRGALRRVGGLEAGMATDPLSALGGVAAGRALGLQPSALQKLSLVDQALAGAGSAVAGAGALQKGGEAWEEAGKGNYGEASLDALEAALGGGFAVLGGLGAARIGAERRAGAVPSGEVYEFDPEASPAERAAAAAKRQAAEAQAQAALEAELLGKQQAEAQAAAQAEAAANAEAGGRLAQFDQARAALTPQDILAEVTGPAASYSDPVRSTPTAGRDPLAGESLAPEAPIFAPARAMEAQRAARAAYEAARAAEDLAPEQPRPQPWAETQTGSLREEAPGRPEDQFARDVRAGIRAAVGDPLETVVLGTPEAAPAPGFVGADVRLSPAALRAAQAVEATGAPIPKARAEASRQAIQAAIMRRFDEALPPAAEPPAPAPQPKEGRPKPAPLQGPMRQAPVESPAAQQDRRFLRVIEPAFRSIERLPGIGRTVAGMGRAFQDAWEKGLGGWTRQAADAAAGLGDNPSVVGEAFEKGGVQKWLDGKGSFDAIPEAMRPAAQKLRAVMDEARDRMLALKLIKPEELQADGSYFPHVAKDETAFSPEQKARDLAIREGLSLEEARAKLSGQSSQVVATRSGHKAAAEHKRLDVLKEGEYRTDIGVIFEHLNEVARRVAEAEHLGPNGEKVHALISRLPSGGKFSDKAFALTFFDRLRGVEQQGRGHAASSAVRSYQAATGLVLSPIAQTTTLANTAAEVGLKATAKSLFDTFGRKVTDSSGKPISWGRPLRRVRAAFHDANMEAEQRGALFSSTAERLAEFYTGGAAPGQGGASRLAKRLPWLRGVEGADAAQRVVASNTAKYVVPEAFAAAKRGDRVAVRQLERWGIDPKAAELTPEMIDGAAKKISDRSQFRVGIGDLPLWASSPWGRVAFQFQSFMYQHTRFMGWAVKEAGKGNIKPLATMATMGAALGYLNQTMRTALKGYGIDKPDEESFVKLLQEAASGRKHFAPTSPKGLALAAVEGLAAAGGVGILQSAVEKAGGDPINLLAGSTGSDLIQAARAGKAYLEQAGAAGQLATARAAGDETGMAAAAKAQEDAAARTGEAGTRLVAGLMPQIPVLLPANELAKELTAETPPERPGWAGRMIDVARGKVGAGEALAGGLVGGGLSPEREAAGAAKRANEAARTATQRLAGLVAPKPPKPGDKRAAEAQRRALRAQFRLAYAEALQSGDPAAQQEVLKAAYKAGVPFSWSQIRALRGLAYMDTEGVE